MDFAILDPAITTSATRGYYVVYLFHASVPVVHLSLNQGTTAVREEFGARTREILSDRANLMRKRVQDFAGALPATTIDLGSTARLPGDYVAGHALGASYTVDALPGEATLRGDLQAIVRAYRALTYRGGIDADVKTQTDLSEEFGIAQSTPVSSPSSSPRIVVRGYDEAAPNLRSLWRTFRHADASLVGQQVLQEDVQRRIPS